MPHYPHYPKVVVEMDHVRGMPWDETAAFGRGQHGRRVGGGGRDDHRKRKSHLLHTAADGYVHRERAPGERDGVGAPYLAIPHHHPPPSS